MLVTILLIGAFVVGIIIACYFYYSLDASEIAFEIVGFSVIVLISFFCILSLKREWLDAFVSTKNSCYTLITTKLGYMQTEIAEINTETEEAEIIELRDKCLYWYIEAIEYNDSISDLQNMRSNVWTGQLYPKAYDNLQLIDESAYADVKKFAQIK